MHRKDTVMRVLICIIQWMFHFLSLILTLSPVYNIYDGDMRPTHRATATRRTIGHRASVTSGDGSSVYTSGKDGAHARVYIIKYAYKRFLVILDFFFFIYYNSVTHLRLNFITIIQLLLYY